MKISFVLPQKYFACFFKLPIHMFGTTMLYASQRTFFSLLLFPFLLNPGFYYIFLFPCNAHLLYLITKTSGQVGGNSLCSEH